MSDKSNSINYDRRILDFQQMDSHASLVEHLEVLMTRYHELNVVPLSMYDGCIVPAILLGRGERMTVYTADTTGNSFLPSQLLMRYINEYCEIRRSGRRVFSIDLQSFELGRSVCIIPLAHTADGAAFGRSQLVGDCRLSLELRHGSSRICCGSTSCTGKYRGVAQSISRLCGGQITVAPEAETLDATPHFEVYAGLDAVGDELDFFRCYTSIRELLFVAPILS